MKIGTRSFHIGYIKGNPNANDPLDWYSWLWIRIANRAFNISWLNENLDKRGTKWYNISRRING